MEQLKSNAYAHCILTCIFDGDASTLPEEKKTGINCLRSSAGYIRTMLGKRMIIRQLPQLNFVIDNSVEEGAAMSKIIDDVIASEKRNAAAAESTGDPENVENS